MGKKRIVKKGSGSVDQGLKSRALSKVMKRRLQHGVVNIQATYNNTLVTLTDTSGNLLFASSSGALGFKGAKKSTPFAAAKVGELIAEKAQQVGIQDVRIVIRGVGPGRESTLRSFGSKGIEISNIQDRTPIPHNGVRAKKPRRV